MAGSPRWEESAPRRRPAAATWLVSANRSVLGSKLMMALLAPRTLIDFMMVMPLRVETAFSMTWETCCSTTLGDAPGNAVLTTTTGMLTVGRRSTPRFIVEIRPKATTATKKPMERT